jgi:hypothetical protein
MYSEMALYPDKLPNTWNENFSNVDVKLRGVNK